MKAFSSSSNKLNSINQIPLCQHERVGASGTHLDYMARGEYSNAHRAEMEGGLLDPDGDPVRKTKKRLLNKQAKPRIGIGVTASNIVAIIAALFISPGG